MYITCSVGTLKKLNILGSHLNFYVLVVTYSLSLRDSGSECVMISAGQKLYQI